MKYTSIGLLAFAFFLYIKESSFWGLLVFAALIVEVNGNKNTQANNGEDK